MANQIPLSGATSAAGGALLTPEQGELLTNAILRANGAVNLIGDRRATNSRSASFPIWLGAPTADVVGEGAQKPVTGGEFGATTVNVKKFASVVLFTDEMLEDLTAGDLNVLVDSGVRSAITDSVDSHIIGTAAGVNITGTFDSMLRSTTSTVELGTTADNLRVAISAAMGVLEGNGYFDQANMGVLLGAGWPQRVRDARSAADATGALYEGVDPTYGLQTEYSTNVRAATVTPAAGIIKGYVVYKPNLHLRVRKDVTVDVSTEATVTVSGTPRNLFQENLTGIRWETRLGFFAHDINRAVVAIIDAA